MAWGGSKQAVSLSTGRTDRFRRREMTDAPRWDTRNENIDLAGESHFDGDSRQTRGPDLSLPLPLLPFYLHPSLHLKP